jgi:hypothetical protein
MKLSHFWENINSMKTIFYFLSFFILLSFSSCRKNIREKDDSSLNSVSKSSDNMEWMKLNNEWVPVITEFDKLLHAGKKAYANKNYKQSSQKIKEANEILIKINDKDHRDKKDLKRYSGSLQKLTERIEDSTASEFDVDTVLYKVCDFSGKHCWIMEDWEDDYWVPEDELNKHMDSVYTKTSINDSTGIINLKKANSLIAIKSRKNSNHKVQKYLSRVQEELKSMMIKAKNEEKNIASKLRDPIARSYFSLSITHYILASIEFNKGRNNKQLGNEIEFSSICLRKAFKYSSVELSEEEDFMLERAQLLGIDLKAGFDHDADDIEDVLRLLNRIIKERRIIFYPESTIDDYTIS